jgi:hypothetical protein
MMRESAQTAQQFGQGVCGIAANPTTSGTPLVRERNIPMLNLERAQQTIAESAVSLPYFIKLHLTVEGLFKRLLFIGLRKNGIQYKTAEQAIAEYWEPANHVIKKAWTLCGMDYKHTVLSDPQYKIMQNLFTGFTSKYRNCLIHGNDGALHNEELVKTLIQVDKLFIRSIETVLKTNNKPSLFEPPRAWGIKPGTITSLDEVFTKLLEDKKIKESPLSLEEVKKQLSQAEFV